MNLKDPLNAPISPEMIEEWKRIMNEAMEEVKAMIAKLNQQIKPMTPDHPRITSLELQLDILNKRNESLSQALNKEIEENKKLWKVAESARKVLYPTNYIKATTPDDLVLARDLQALDEVKSK